MKYRKPSKTLANELFALMHKGNSYSKSCRDINAHKGELWKFINNNPQLSEQYARARESCISYMANEIIEIADEMPLTEPQTGKIDRAAVEWQKLRLDSRKWLLSKVLPKQYGNQPAKDDNKDDDVEIEI